MSDLQPMNAALEKIWVDARDDWRTRRDDYGDAFLELGAKGQFSDIWRKVYKLKRSVWEGHQLTGEPAEQVAKEIMPHCAMLVYLLDRQERDAWAATENDTQIITPPS